MEGMSPIVFRVLKTILEFLILRQMNVFAQMNIEVNQIMLYANPAMKLGSFYFVIFVKLFHLA